MADLMGKMLGELQWMMVELLELRMLSGIDGRRTATCGWESGDAEEGSGEQFRSAEVMTRWALVGEGRGECGGALGC